MMPPSLPRPGFRSVGLLLLLTGLAPALEAQVSDRVAPSSDFPSPAAIASGLKIDPELKIELVAAEPLAEIEGLVRDCFSHLVSTPHLVVRINDGLYEAAHERIEKMAKQSGFQGRLVILAEPDIATGDCRIEWADGGVVLERSVIDAKIGELVGRYVASRKKKEKQEEAD